MTCRQPRLMLSSMHCRIVFMESKPGGLVVDALTSNGEALSLDAHVPVSTWGFAAALTLGRWAELGSQVEVELYDKREIPRVRLSDDDHLVVLDLSRRAAVSPDAGQQLDQSEKERAVRGPRRRTVDRVGGPGRTPDTSGGSRAAPRSAPVCPRE